MESEILKLREAARILGRSEKTVSRWIRSGRMKGHVLDGRVVVLRSDLVEFIKRNVVPYDPQVH